jgi:hypothetical protein
MTRLAESHDAPVRLASITSAARAAISRSSHQTAIRVCPTTTVGDASRELHLLVKELDGARRAIAPAVPEDRPHPAFTKQGPKLVPIRQQRACGERNRLGGRVSRVGHPGHCTREV